MYVEFAHKALSVGGQKGVDETENLHDALVLSYVFVSLETELVLLPVAARNRKPSRTLFRRNNAQLGDESRDANHWLPTLVCAGDDELEVLRAE